MVNLALIIITYNRPGLLLDLLGDIKKQMPWAKIRVYDDCSTVDYTPVIAFLEKNFDDYSFKTMPFNHGKERWWLLHQKIYTDLRGEVFTYYMQLTDDMRLVDKFYPEVIDQFNRCGAGALNIYLTKVLDGKLRSGSTKLINGFWQINWIDGAFITRREFFEKIGFTCPWLPEARFIKKNVSSGVGTALTNLYKSRGGRAVLVSRSLLIHKGYKSEMRPDRRGAETMV
jgi:glycosyltransferase involved in cell wall biosynthesis